MKAPESMFSKSYIGFVAIFTLVLIGAITYGMYLVGGDWKGILIVLIISAGIFSLLIISGIKYSRKTVPLTKGKIEKCKAKEMLSDPSNVSERFDEYVRASSGFGGRLNFILILARYGNWPIFLLFLWGTFNLYTKGIWHNFQFVCPLTFLWFPLIDKLFSRKLDFLMMFLIKFVITICAMVLLQIIQVFG